MKKYLIKWNSGYGDTTAVVEYETHKEANEHAYEEWRQEVENQADYSAELLTERNALDYGHVDELEETRE